jgi:hypothetical protein
VVDAAERDLGPEVLAALRVPSSPGRATVFRKNA